MRVKGIHWTMDGLARHYKDVTPLILLDVRTGPDFALGYHNGYERAIYEVLELLVGAGTDRQAGYAVAHHLEVCDTDKTTSVDKWLDEHRE